MPAPSLLDNQPIAPSQTADWLAVLSRALQRLFRNDPIRGIGAPAQAPILGPVRLLLLVIVLLVVRAAEAGVISYQNPDVLGSGECTGGPRAPLQRYEEAGIRIQVDELFYEGGRLACDYSQPLGGGWFALDPPTVGPIIPLGIWGNATLSVTSLSGAAITGIRFRLPEFGEPFCSDTIIVSYTLCSGPGLQSLVFPVGLQSLTVRVRFVPTIHDAFFRLDEVTIPEPSTLTLFAVAGLLLVRRLRES